MLGSDGTPDAANEAQNPVVPFRIVLVWGIGRKVQQERAAYMGLSVI